VGQSLIGDAEIAVTILDNPMNKVYVFEEGDYSDRKIKGVFSTIEKAEEFRDRWGDPKEGGDCISEWLVDEGSEVPVGMKLFYVCMYKDGSIYSVYENFNPLEYRVPLNIRWFPSTRKDFDDSRMFVVVAAKNEQHAIKIINEIRAQIVAENLWMVAKTF
jgi:hypothetical protein